LWLAQRAADRRLAELVPWVVDRPTEVDQVVAAPRRQDGGSDGRTFIHSDPSKRQVPPPVC
jgi:hypothetical protein